MTTRPRTSRSSRRKRAGSKTERPGSVEVEVLLDLARPWRTRKLPPPGTSVVYDRHYSDLEHEGFLHWVQAHPHHTSMTDDHYELTPRGHARVASYRQWMTNLGTSKHARHANLGRSGTNKNKAPRLRHGDLGPQFITGPGSRPGLVNVLMVNSRGEVLQVLHRNLPYQLARDIIRGKPVE